MNIYTILIIVLIVVLLFSLPVGPWPRWHSYGYAPGGLVAVILIVFVVLLLLGRI